MADDQLGEGKGLPRCAFRRTQAMHGGRCQGQEHALFLQGGIKGDGPISGNHEAGSRAAEQPSGAFKAVGPGHKHPIPGPEPRAPRSFTDTAHGLVTGY